MQRKRIRNIVLAGLMTGGAGVVAASPAFAAGPVKIGIVLPLSGKESPVGIQMQNGIKLFLKENGNTVAGRPIEVIFRDEKGFEPEVSKRLAQELVTQDKVQILAGFALSPNALAIAPIATQAHVATVVMNGTAVSVPSRSPYIIRTSYTQPQVVEPLARWASENGFKTAYSVVSDFSAGIDAESAFTNAYKAAGGSIIGSTRTPLTTVEFAPTVQRAKDSKPKGVFFFVPSPGGLAFLKSYVSRQVSKGSVTLLTTGDLVEETTLPAIGRDAVGIISAHPYSVAHNTAINHKFVADYKAMFGRNSTPNVFTVGAYDGMRVIYEALKKTQGDATGDRVIAAAKGLTFESPRGQVMIDPKTRDIIQSIYIRRTEFVKGILQNTEIKEYPAQHAS